jgi:hypothetical protein
MAAFTTQQLDAFAQANQILVDAGNLDINTMLDIQAKAVQKALQPVLQITVRSNYGAPAIYPVNEAAKIFAAIAGTKTLQLNTLAKAKQLGYRIVRDGDSIEVPGLAGLVEG